MLFLCKINEARTMVATAANEREDGPCVFGSEGDAVWLVRQFGRYAHLLQTKSCAYGGTLLSSATFGSLVGARTPQVQEHTQARLLLQLSNRQHQERLRSMMQLSAAHQQRMHHSAKGQKRRRTRGCELGAESSSSSSTEGEPADAKGTTSTADASPEKAWRPAGLAMGSTGGTAARTEEESNPLLLAAYDLLTCTTRSASDTAATLPPSLLHFLSSNHHKPRKPTPSRGNRASDNGSSCLYTVTKDNAGGLTRVSYKSDDGDDPANSFSSHVGFGGNLSLDPGKGEFHPIRQLQESVLKLPEQNQDTKNHLMGEQLRLLAVRWKCLLLSGWNVLVAGCGSKGGLLRDFASLALTDGFCCVLNAYQREFKLQQALHAIVQIVRNHLRTTNKYTAAAAATVMAAGTAGGASASCDRLVKELKALLLQCAHPLYLVVLGLDSSALTDARRHLATLASYDKVRLICSADHLQHALLLDAAELRDFRFVFETAHTRRDYREEVLSRWGSMCGFVPGWLWSASRAHTAGACGSGVNFAVVLRGLTTNHKRLLRSIAELQLAQLARNESPIVGLADLGTETSGVSLSLSKLKLKELLVEVTSHGAAVQARKNGQDAVIIRANKTQLLELLELLEKAGV